MQGRPKNKISREEIAKQFSVTTRTVINWESYGFLPKGQKVKGFGSVAWYDQEDVQKLKNKINKD